MVRLSGLRRYLAILVLTAISTAAPAQSSELDAASPAELIEILKANVALTGDIVKRLEAQKRLERIGKRDPQAVVPLVVRELSPPRTYGKMATHRRLALVELLRDLGPAAESGISVLVDIMNDPEEAYESIKSQSATALLQIGTVEAKAAAQAYFTGLQTQFAAKAGETEAARSASQDAFLIRQELRGHEPSDGVIAASVDGLRALGPRAAKELPTLLRAYNDPRLGSRLRATIGDAIRAAGIVEVASSAAQAAEKGVPDILSEVVAETQHPDPFVSSLAMTELARLGPSDAAIDGMIRALREGRNPGDAARVLGEFGVPAARALPEIARYFEDELAGANAIQAVGRIGAKDPAVIAALRHVLATPGHRYRGQAASALGKLKAEEALPELRRTLLDGGKYDRILSAAALGRLGPIAAPAIDNLSATLDDPDMDLRRVAVVALGQIGEAAAPAVAALAAQLESGDKRLEQSAREALAAIGGPQAEAALRQDAARYADADIAQIHRLAKTHGTDGMTQYLYRLPAQRADPLARRLLSDPEPDTAYIGALFLAHQGDIEPAIPILADNLARRPDANKILNGLGYSMVHGGDATQIRPLLDGLSRFIDQNADRYTQEERARLDALLSPRGRR